APIDACVRPALSRSAGCVLSAPATERQPWLHVEQGLGKTMTNDIDALTALNRDFVASAQNSDVRRFDEILAPEFYCSNPDKSLVDRDAFLEQTAKPVAIKNLRAHDIKIRIMGDFAIIHAATSYTTPDGQQAHGRYTDCWAKQNGKWLAVSAHVAR